MIRLLLAELVDALGRYWPGLLGPVSRPLLLKAIIAVICWINVRGIRQSSLVVNVLTVAKLLPLLVFTVVGIFYVNWGSFTERAAHDGRAAADLRVWRLRGRARARG